MKKLFFVLTFALISSFAFASTTEKANITYFDFENVITNSNTSELLNNFTFQESTQILVDVEVNCKAIGDAVETVLTLVNSK